jgi:hypothetical protein
MPRSSQGTEALAAAALISAAVTSPPAQPEEVAGLCSEGSVPTSPKDRAAAKTALDRIIGNESELREIWSAAGSLDEFLQTVARVRSNL